MNVLILSAGTRNKIVQYFRRTLAGSGKVIATGGLGRIIADETQAIDIYNSALTLEGLRILYEKNKK